MSTKRVLISVSDKTGIVDFAKVLQQEFDYEILSTGGTEKALREAGLSVTPVEKYTGFPEMLDGRVKTLHPFIHGGLLALRDNNKHLQQLRDKGIGLIDMVVVNLYPFRKTVQGGASFHEIIENIDIGGPSMLRSAAKNFQSVAVIPSVEWYPRIISELRGQKGNLLPETKKELAKDVFWITAQYDNDIAKYLSEGKRQMLPLELVSELRYGENPHQKGSLWRDPTVVQESKIASARQRHGKDMSFLNYYDSDSALNLVREFDEPAAVFVKHGNPCGTAEQKTIFEAFQKAYESDSISAFGVIIAVNRPVTKEIANFMEKNNMFVEVLIAPSFEKEAFEVLTKKKNIRLLEIGNVEKLSKQDLDIKKISGGYLIQDSDSTQLEEKNLQLATVDLRPTSTQMKDLLFAWKVVKHVKSNAIVIAKDSVTVGVGAGQMSRVDSTQIALAKAGSQAVGAVMASDAFFPFSDSLDFAGKSGISAIIQPGGSVKDSEVIAKAKELKISMVLTGKRAFKH